MRKRNNCVRFYLNDDELADLTRKVASTVYKRDAFLRALVTSSTVIERPPVEYGEIVKQLRRIGANVDQLLVMARVHGFVDELKLKSIAEQIDKMDLIFITSFSSR